MDLMAAIGLLSSIVTLEEARRNDGSFTQYGRNE